MLLDCCEGVPCCHRNACCHLHLCYECYHCVRLASTLFHLNLCFASKSQTLVGCYSILFKVLFCFHSVIVLHSILFQKCMNIVSKWITFSSPSLFEFRTQQQLSFAVWALNLVPIGLHQSVHYYTILATAVWLYPTHCSSVRLLSLHPLCLSQLSKRK